MNVDQQNEDQLLASPPESQSLAYSDEEHFLLQSPNEDLNALVQVPCSDPPKEIQSEIGRKHKRMHTEISIEGKDPDVLSNITY